MPNILNINSVKYGNEFSILYICFVLESYIF